MVEKETEDDKIRLSLRELTKDRYRDFHLAGSGGMGLVYLAVDTDMNREIAFKVIRADPPGDDVGATPNTPLGIRPPEPDTADADVYEGLRARFLQEAWVTGGLEHPGIVPVYELGRTAEGVPYYTMRFVRGQRTLADVIAQNRNAPYEQRAQSLEPFLKLCDTVSYAHAKGVIHRDLKPENVAIGEYGEVVLLDWGLAKLEGLGSKREDVWQAHIDQFRETESLQTLTGGLLGTPGYMAPEVTRGDVDAVDRRSDVYSLGAILFEILADRLPFEPRELGPYLKTVSQEDAPRAHDLRPDVPPGLSEICAAALARSPSDRLQTVADLGKAIRAWQAQSLLDREVATLTSEALRTLDAADGLTGDELLREVDRAAETLARAASLEPDSEALSGHRERARALRDRGIRERERSATRRVLQRVALVAVILVSIGAFIVAGALESERRETEEALNEKTVALNKVLRLADAKRVADLLTEENELWPLHPYRASAMADWIHRAESLLESRSVHEETLETLHRTALAYAAADRKRDHAADERRLATLQEDLGKITLDWASLKGHEDDVSIERRRELLGYIKHVNTQIKVVEELLGKRITWRFNDPSSGWKHQVLRDLLDGMKLLHAEDVGQGVLQSVRERHRFTTGLREDSVDSHAAVWRETIRAISLSPKYGGLKISPQLGLIPLGPDPSSGLFEFAHLGSGSMPTRDPRTGLLVLDDDFAIVLVLIPAGTFSMGAQEEDPGGGNYDADAQSDQAPVHKVTLSTYLLSKYECTKAQWTRMTGGLDPSAYRAGMIAAGRKLTTRNPVEQVSWRDCSEWLERNRLTLPTEAQWEHACRAGTGSQWSSGTRVADLQKVANIADAYLDKHGGTPYATTSEVNDGHGTHAPVGSFAANDFGLHDLHGNVTEWCSDYKADYGPEDTENPIGEGHGDRIHRGGSWSSVATFARSAYREWADEGARGPTTGVRPASHVAVGVAKD